jgi:RimJ/RimL family protein N-acetyltransferase
VLGIDDGCLVGVIGLRGEFGFWLARQARGRGYATEAGKALVAVAFRRIGLRRLEARVFRDNLASRHTLAKLGFREAGRTAAFSRGRNATVPAVRLRLERRVWEATQTRDE